MISSRAPVVSVQLAGREKVPPAQQRSEFCPCPRAQQTPFERGLTQMHHVLNALDPNLLGSPSRCRWHAIAGRIVGFRRQIDQHQGVRPALLSGSAHKSSSASSMPLEPSPALPLPGHAPDRHHSPRPGALGAHQESRRGRPHHVLVRPGRSITWTGTWFQVRKRFEYSDSGRIANCLLMRWADSWDLKNIACLRVYCLRARNRQPGSPVHAVNSALLGPGARPLARRYAAASTCRPARAA